MIDWKEFLAPSLRALHLGSLRSKMLLFALLTTLAPTLAITLVFYDWNRASLTNTVGQELRNASSETARELSQWLDERLRDLRVAASSYVLAENTPRTRGTGASKAVGHVRDYLTSVRERFTDYEALLVTDGSGHALASSGRVTGIQVPWDRLTGLAMGDALIGDAYWDATMAKAALALAVPIRQADGRFLGALVAKVNLRSVADLLQRLSPRDAADIYLMTDQGKLILRSGASSAELMRTKLPPATAQALLDQEGVTVEYKGADGLNLVGTLRRVPVIHWAAVTEMPRTEARREVARLRNATLLIVVAMLVGVGLIAYVAGLLIARPLERLASAASKVAAGDLSVELPPGGSGEVGYLTRALNHLLTRLREREGQGELERLSVTDALTGLYNRRHLMGTLSSEVQRSRRLRRTFSVLLADLDHFKQYNDTHGHPAGDAALVKVTEILRRTTRAVDCVARYGGEEFVVMLIETTIGTAALVAERIRARVAVEEFGGGRMTVSIGVAEYPPHGDTPEELIASADAVMYQAKGGGRDRVVSAGERREDEKPKRKQRKAET